MTNKEPALPNIVFIMPDQLRWDFVSAYGKQYADTPNIDALAARGTVYDRCVSPSPACVPARASMLTGHNSLSTGVLNNFFWLRPDHDACGVPTFAGLLREVGYHTEAIGKMHFMPWDHSEGFDHRVIAEDKRHIHIRDDYFDYLSDTGREKAPPASEPGYVENLGASISTLSLEHQVDPWVGRQVVSFVENQTSEQPFLLWVGFPGPHDPYNPPADLIDAATDDLPPAFPNTELSNTFRSEMIDKLRGGISGLDITQFDAAKKSRMRKHYRALVSIIDQQVGDIVRALDERNDGRETLIIFASDHGDFLGDFDFLGKFLFFESSIRVPMIVAGGDTPVSRQSELVSLTDVFATMVAAAGVSANLQDSIPLPGIGLGDECREYVMGATDRGYMITGKCWKLCRYRNGACSLHEVSSDPGEQINRWDDPSVANIKQKLDGMLQGWLITSVMDGHKDKSFPNAVLDPEHRHQFRNAEREYPVNGHPKPAHARRLSPNE